MRGAMDVVAEYSRSMKRRDLSARTIYKRQSELRSWLVHVDGWWMDASTEDVQLWLDGRPLAAQARYASLSHLHRFYAWAKRESLTTHDPTERIERPRLPHRLPRPAPLLDVDEAIAAAPPEMRVILCLMADAGLRCIEVSRLRRRDVDLVAGTMYVTGKGDRDRLVGTPDRLRRELYLTFGGVTDPDVLVTGRAMSANWVSRIVSAYLRSVGVFYTAHQLRHTYATRLYTETGGDLLTVQQALGHASVVSTQIYAAIDPARALAAARRLR